MDLVLNHVAREHDVGGAGAGGRAGVPRLLPRLPRPRPARRLRARRCPRSSRTSRPATSPGTTTLDGWVWTTFNEWQWDLNWAQPRGAGRVRRHHPVPGQPRRRGAPARRHRVPLEADGHQLPEPARGARDHPGAARAWPGSPRPAVAFKAEAIVGPRDLVQYLGTGRHAGRVSDLAYHNSLMVQVWSMLATGDTVLARHALAALPPTPDHRHLDHLRALPRRHRLGDRRRATPPRSGSTATTHRRFLSDWYAGDFPGLVGRGPGLPAQPRHRRQADQRHRRLAGRADEASRPRRGRGAGPDVPGARDRGRLGRRARDLERRRAGPAQRPAMGREPGHEDDNRWAHRPRLDWSRAAARHDLRTVARPGVLRAGAPGPGPRRAAAAARLRRERGAPGHRRRRARRGPPARQRPLRRPLQRHRRSRRPVPDRTGCARPA